MSIGLSTTLISNHRKIELSNPVIAASGSFGFGPELSDVVDFSKIGAITIKSLAPFHSEGNPAPRVAATEVGMMNSVGQPGPDIRDWVKKDAYELKKLGGRFIMSIWGRTTNDYKVAAEAIVDILDMFIGVEINLSCPNVHGDGLFFAQVPEQTNEIVKIVRNVLGDDVFISSKLTAAVRSVVEVADGAIDGGTDAFTLFNTLLGLNIDPYTRNPVLGKGAGGYSGKAIFPIVQRGVYELHKAYPEIPIIGTGGIFTGADAAAMMMCGATAVGIAAATFAEPTATLRIAKELEDFCLQTGVRDVKELIGSAQMP